MEKSDNDKTKNLIDVMSQQFMLFGKFELLEQLREYMDSDKHEEVRKQLIVEANMIATMNPDIFQKHLNKS